MAKTLQRRFISMFDTAVEGLWIMTPEGEVSFYNHSFYEQFDLELVDSKLEDWTSLIHPEDQNNFDDRVGDHLDGDTKDERVFSQYRVLKRDGSYCWIEAIGVLKQDEHGEYMVGNHRDITEQKKLESSIKRLAFTDRISGLPNLEQLKADLANRRSNVTLIKIHLDGIKSYINHYGENSIQEIIDRIIECSELFSSYPSSFYRTEIDAFSVLLTSCVADRHLAELCQEFISLFNSATEKSGELYVGGIYIGAYPANSPDISTETILAWANQTCEYALRHEPVHWAICTDDVLNKIERYFFIEKNLKSAIDHDEISIRLQPIICTRTEQIRSFEALARWENSEIGEIYPDEFIPAAERQNLIKALGEKVLTQASSFIAYYNKSWNSRIKVNVNVSVLQLMVGGFPERSLQIVQDEGISPESIVLELTESVLLEGQYKAMSQLRELEKIGFTLAMDDFGSGHSSITDFFKLPFHSLKIDKELANESMRELEPFAYLEFLTMLCGMRDIAVTVEGIETNDMVSKFVNMDVSYFQGYLYAKPMKIETAMAVNPQESLKQSD